MHKTKKGFTIVELVIVIAVIAILAAVLIPTFSNLVEKANQSVDVQLVRQMNTILKTDEPVNGKPANIAAVKSILADNGITDLEPALNTSVFAWDSVNNVVVLLDKETSTGAFPEEYKGVAYDPATWVIFGGAVNKTLPQGSSLKDALANTSLGETIVLSEDQTLGADELPEYVNIDLDGHTLTLTNGLEMAENSNVIISNGNVESTQISVPTGATLVLDDVKLDTGNACAIFPGIAACIDITDSTIISDCPIGTNYSDDISKAITVNISNTTLGSADEPCSVGVMMITSGDITVSNCTIYASGTGILNRAGNVTVDNTVINYSPDKDFSDTYFGSVSAENTYKGKTPGNVRQMMWSSGSGGFNAPIVVGDFWAKHYSHDANCTLINVTVNSTNATYPDVYLSQENYDIFLNADPNNRVAGTAEIVKTTLTCDSTITWMVNPGKNDAFIDNCVDGMEHFATYSGFGYSGSGYGGVAALYVDNVFVNGVEQAPGSTSENPEAAGDLAVYIPDFVGTLAAGEYSVSVLGVNHPSIGNYYDYTAEVIQALKDDCGLELTKEQLISATLRFGSTPNYLKSVVYTKDGQTYTQTVTGNVTAGRLAIAAISHLGLTGDNSGSVLVNEATTYLDTFKAFCAAHGITLTGSSKIVVGANNTIIGVK